MVPLKITKKNTVIEYEDKILYLNSEEKNTYAELNQTHTVQSKEERNYIVRVALFAQDRKTDITHELEWLSGNISPHSMLKIRDVVLKKTVIIL